MNELRSSEATLDLWDGRVYAHGERAEERLTRASLAGSSFDNSESRFCRLFQENFTAFRFEHAGEVVLVLVDSAPLRSFDARLRRATVIGVRSLALARLGLTAPVE